MFDEDILSLFNPFNWDKESYKFNRAEKDMHPYSVYNTEKMVIIVHNVLGIEKKDLKILVEDEKGNSYIKIVGATTDSITKNKYTVDSTFNVGSDELIIEKATSNMKNGLLYITIPKREKKVAKATKKYIEIN